FYAVVHLMRRAAFILECALETHPNITLIGEEVLTPLLNGTPRSIRNIMGPEIVTRKLPSFGEAGCNFLFQTWKGEHHICILNLMTVWDFLIE
ncbi:hypothetical protein Tco_1560356, partial [Tanacetum coccineum]